MKPLWGFQVVGLSDICCCFRVVCRHTDLPSWNVCCNLPSALSIIVFWLIPGGWALFSQNKTKAGGWVWSTVTSKHLCIP